MKTILLAMALCMVSFGANAEFAIKASHGGPNSTMTITCNPADAIEKSLIDNGFTKTVMGRGARGMIFETWIGDIGGKSNWLLFFYDDKNGVRCQISAGIVGEKVIPFPKAAPKPEGPAPTIKDFKKKPGLDA